MIKQNSAAVFLRRLRPFIKGTVASVISLAIFSALFAAIYQVSGAPEDTETILALICVGISAMAGGFFCAGTIGRNGLLWGAAAGGITLLLCIVGAILTDGLSGGQALIRVLICEICSAAGGVIAVNLRSR